ncbi:MAG: hypothetical protein LBG61_06330 [Burkholderiales bacterium]|jgi:hypothetical protein|nr:hypothetical protein [Burkholderiales bacterium]
MLLIRVYIDRPFDARDEYEWALFDAHGQCQREGKTLPADFPKADRHHAVLSVTLTPSVILRLPPMSGARLEGAVRLALEDRLIGAVDAYAISLALLPEGGVLVRRVEKSLLDALKKAGFTQVISEADLVETFHNTWQCCVNAHGAGFVRRDDKTAFSVHLSGESMPQELALALKQSDPKPEAVVLQMPHAHRIAAHWQNSDPLIRWRAGQPWNLMRAPSDRFAAAVNLLPQDKKTAGVASMSLHPFWRYGVIALLLAGVLHVAATTLAWGYAHFSRRQIVDGFERLAKEAGVPVQASPVATQKALDRALENKWHKAGLLAPDDAIALLAKCAAVLSAMPPARSAQYDHGSWTLEWSQLSPEQQKAVETQLRREGLSVMGGVNPSGGFKLRIERAYVAF